MAGRLLKIEEIEQNYAKVGSLSDKSIEISELMNSAYSNRSEALDDLYDRWNDYNKAESNLLKAKKQFRKGKIGADEYQWFVDEFNYRKRRSKRASKRYKEANNEIRKLRQGKEEIKSLLRARIN